ncbi:MAG: hypothetical protein ACJ764_03080 [Solirubrobacteraceae bacterium]
MSTAARRVALGLAICLGLVSAACTAAASSSSSGTTAPRGGHPGSHSTPRRDRFRGSIVSATGKYAGDTGRAAIYLHPRGSGKSRVVRIVFRGSPCGTASQCLDLRGRLVGKLIRSAQGVPDTGSHYALVASGKLTQLGSVTARGAVQGTGFISHGHERMTITLTNSSGTVKLVAHSPVVKGFTSP